MLRRLPPRLGLSMCLSLGLLSLTACIEPAQQVVYAQPGPQMGHAQRRNCDTSFRVVNASSSVVEKLYFNPSARSDWGNDRLGQEILRPGRSTNHRAQQAGDYDFRVVWANGRSAEIRNIDVCAASTITVTNYGLRAT